MHNCTHDLIIRQVQVLYMVKLRWQEKQHLSSIWRTSCSL